MSYIPNRLVGNEHLHDTTSALDDATVLDFWQWAFSNLRMNNTRGIFAEWMVAKLLEIPQPIRETWGESDLIASERVRIEVKTSAYVQAWEHNKPSRIGFTGLKARKLDSSTNTYSDIATSNADIYVFCVQIEIDETKWNALDVDQWRFYTLRQEAMILLGWKSLSLATIERLCKPMKAAEFSNYTKGMIQDILRVSV